MTRVPLGRDTEACRQNNAEALGCPSQPSPEEHQARDEMRRMVVVVVLAGASRDELPGQSSRRLLSLSLGLTAAYLVPPLLRLMLMRSAHEYQISALGFAAFLQQLPRGLPQATSVDLPQWRATLPHPRLVLLMQSAHGFEASRRQHQPT